MEMSQTNAPLPLVRVTLASNYSSKLLTEITETLNRNLRSMHLKAINVVGAQCKRRGFGEVLTQRDRYCWFGRFTGFADNRKNKNLWLWMPGPKGSTDTQHIAFQ